MRYILYVITIVSIVVILIVASSIATVPRGGTRHSYSILLNDVEGTVKWERAYYGTFTKHGAYYGHFKQTLCEVDYPVGLVNAYWDISGVHLNVFRGDYRENLTGKLWFFLELWPNHQWPDFIYKFEEATFTLYGSGEYVKFHSLSIFWGSYSPEHRIRLDKGYKVTLFVTIKIESSTDYGDLDVCIPLSANLGHNYVTIHDVQVSSQYQDGMANLLCGVFVGIYCLILAKPLLYFLKQRVEKRG